MSKHIERLRARGKIFKDGAPDALPGSEILREAFALLQRTRAPDQPFTVTSITDVAELFLVTDPEDRIHWVNVLTRADWEYRQHANTSSSNRRA